MSAFKQRFQELTQKTTDEQQKFFQQRFVFLLADRYWEVADLRKTFDEMIKRDDDIAKAKGSLSQHVAGDFLTKTGHTRTALQRKAELADVDMNNDGRTSFIELLLLHFKTLILTEFFRRQDTEPDVDLSNDGVGLTGVGDRLIEELYAPPQGVDPELEKMMKQFSQEHARRKKEVADLEEVVAQGGVKGMAAKGELEKLKHRDESDMHAIEARIAAAIKKAEKKTIEEMARRESEAEAEKAKAAADRKAGLASRVG